MQPLQCILADSLDHLYLAVLMICIAKAAPSTVYLVLYVASLYDWSKIGLLLGVWNHAHHQAFWIVNSWHLDIGVLLFKVRWVIFTRTNSKGCTDSSCGVCKTGQVLWGISSGVGNIFSIFWGKEYLLRYLDQLLSHSKWQIYEIYVSHDVRLLLLLKTIRFF